jgi:hypothetical protein
MASRERIRELMEALGPSDEEIAAITQNGDDQWAVAFDEDTIVLLDFVEDQAKLVLSIDLGRPAPASRAAVYETMLNYNTLWPETGGVKMGLGGSDGELVQMFELNAADLDGERLRTVLEGFILKARMWRGFVAEGPAAEAAPEFFPGGLLIRA